MELLLRDIRLAARSLVRTRGFALAAVLTLALGIGANTAIFSAVHGVLLRPLPYPDDERLTVLWLNNQREGIQRDVTSYPTFRDWAEASTYEAMAGHGTVVATLTETGDPEQVRGARVTADFFRVLGVEPQLGRAIGRTETEGGDHRVVVLSNGLWTRQFGADPAVIGRTIRMGESYQVVGVMPPAFRYPDGAEFWVPLARTESTAPLLEARGALWLSVIGRLAPGAGLLAADAELNGIMEALGEDYPVVADNGVFIEPLRETMVGDVRPALLVLLGAVGFVLLIACANIANLLLARGAARRKEMAVRSALGASRGRLARQTLTESLVLAGTGGALGVLLAFWGTSAMVAASPPELPRLDQVRVDGVVVAFAAALSILTGVVFGLAPAIQARTAAIGATLRDGGRGVSGERAGRLRPALIMAEVALSLVLLTGAGLLMRSFASLQAIEPGFETESVLTFRLSLGSDRYPAAPQVRAFRDELMERVSALPGVRETTAINTLFLDRLPNMAPVTIEGREPPGPDEQVTSVTTDLVEPGFFRAMGVPIVRGRGFGPEDGVDGLPVAIVNQAFVRRFLPEDDPVGRRFTWGDPENPETVWLTIIGVAADTRRSGLAAPVRPEAYRTTSQLAGRSLEYVVLTAGNPLAAVPAIRSLIRQMDPDLPMAQVRTVEQAMGEAVATRRFIMLLLAGFAAIALTLTAVGIYGVLAFLVGRRTRELGIRIALGAGRGQVLGIVLKDALRAVLPGVAIGLAGALVLTRFLSAQLFGVSPTDPTTFGAVTALLLLVAFAASWIPARRAAAVEPMVTLKEE